MQRPIVVAFPFAGGEFGGSDISATNLIASLDREKVNPVLMVHDGKGDFSDYLKDMKLSYINIDDVEVLRPQYGKSVGRIASAAMKYPASVFKLRQILRHFKAEIVHTNNGLIHATWAAPAVLAGAKLLWHHRGDPTAKGVNMVAPLFASHVVTVSKFAQPASPILSLEHRMSVVHSPFDHPASLPDRNECRLAIIRELGLSEDTRFVGYFGALIDRKRPLRFVEAVHAFARQNPDFPISGLLFGPPEQYGVRMDGDVMARARELGVADKIHVMGFRRPVDPYLCCVDILLVPAVNEPFGRTLIEAMLLGTPVIATRHGGNPEAIVDGKTGFLVEPENPSAFVDPMTRLLTDPAEWLRISDTSRTTALTSYSVRHHVDCIMNIYRTLAGRTEPSIAAP